MKQLMRTIAMLLVLLMTVSVFAACGNKQDDREDPKETERETERETEVL
jgi:predicted small lipoprotein YifL